MSVEIRYASRRAEVWRWYWKSWIRGLWRVHLALIAGVVCAVYLADHGSESLWRTAVQASCWAAAAIGFLVLYPQLLFKPQERTLTLDATGVSTVIGRRSGVRVWAEIASIAEDGDFIVLRSVNGNAFIVPPRAFPSSVKRAEFLAFARQAKADAASSAH